MTWLYYLLEANLYLSLLYAFYKLVLQRNTFYNYNRWYLIVIPIIAFTLPLLTVQHINKNVAGLYSARKAKLISAPTNLATTSRSVDFHKKVSSSLFELLNLYNLIFTIYIVVVFLFLVSTTRGIYKLIQLYRRSAKYRQGNTIYVVLTEEQEAFSFFNWLFYYPNIQSESTILKHELVHIRQRHSMDILFFEILLGLNWFNPLIYLLCRDVKLNHEYLADEQASLTVTNKYDYALLLINNASRQTNYPLAHAIFNHSQLKQRISKLSVQNSPGKAKAKYLLVFPLVLVLATISAFTISKNYGVIKFRIAQKLIVPYPHQANFYKIDMLSRAMELADKKETRLKKPISTKPINESSKLSLINALVDAKDKGKKLYATDFKFAWALNKTGAKIRTPIHSIYSGTEAQLFRGKDADTLYVDIAKCEIKDGTAYINTDHLMIGYPVENSSAAKKLILIDAGKMAIAHILPRVVIKTKGSIFSIDNKKAEDDGEVKFRLLSLNSRVREATIINDEIITNESDSDNAPYQPDIIW